ncbi:antibiotic biosynthesis monooxygenase-like protein [Karstenula rhodostoma CBS 690.94]|uniref:Antibiotic biosynthesis monooxygenase-like protein n=1 Tax=Karstenula rhodostoma CBS 690.94 TaxID=1392251 RepID=A0A9P4PEV9_9PLEO|nr:antibiotic biosynthesis monooxygenase-like protein [Karstenula rhodostoma CBS 690.94]
MSAPFDIIAIIKPRPGSADRVVELLKIAAESVKAKEPGTLRYQINRETKGDAPQIVMLETYKDLAALQAHGSSEYFKEMSKTLKEEDLLSEPMQVLFTKDVGGYVSKL